MNLVDQFSLLANDYLALSGLRKKKSAGGHQEGLNHLYPCHFNEAPQVAYCKTLFASLKSPEIMLLLCLPLPDFRGF
ncbi:MAG: hypothetical protein WKF97_26730 [Chitinophagaceae bacterium]